MNKLTALSKLSGAYHYLIAKPADHGDNLALEELEVQFGYIRRSLRIADLKPVHNTEGMNPSGPKYL